uniref:Right handed beta helix domain-containing protein n=1 Tax=Amphimedon queenslandica TaxID=400682 RepID=A0A1X7UYP5_AMPQE
MCLLLLAVFLLSISSSDVSSHQEYIKVLYVSDNCSSVAHTPCDALSVYAQNISQFNNAIFYFIGTSNINSSITIDSVDNIALHGMLEVDNVPIVKCRNHKSEFSIKHSSHVSLSNVSFHNCYTRLYYSQNITITGSSFKASPDDYGVHVIFSNAFDVNLFSSSFTNIIVQFLYNPPKETCHHKLHHYSLMLVNVSLFGRMIEINLKYSTSYNLSIIIDHVNISKRIDYSRNGSIYFILHASLFNAVVTHSSFYDSTSAIGLRIETMRYTNVTCDIDGVRLVSTLLIEDSQSFGNEWGVVIKGGYTRFNSALNIVIKLSAIFDNLNGGLHIDGSFLASTISIIDTKLAGNMINNILNCHSIFLSNVTIANSLSTGLILIGSIVTVYNSLVFRNNTGVTGGGLQMNATSYLVFSPEASIKFIDNYASYRGGGIYYDTLIATCPFQSLQFNSESPVSFTFWNNTAKVAGDDMYGIITSRSDCNVLLNITNPIIKTSGIPDKLCYCNFKNDVQYHNCFYNIPEQNIFPGQSLKFNVALFGLEYNAEQSSVTDGTVYVFIDGVLVNHTYITSNCSLIKYSPKQPNYTRYQIRLSSDKKYEYYRFVQSYFTIHECPIGFNVSNSQGICTCSQSVSRENVTCDINTLNITHNGLLWIGTYHTSTPFNANATNPNACIINEDCLLYCSPNPVTFKLNDTDAQCVDNRGRLMCGSCRGEYSLLLGSNKCGQCHDDYMMIAWVSLFAVMGVMLVLLLIALNLTVSVGTLNGLLFYANIVKLYEPVFIRERTIPVLSQVISWINLDFGFEICFYKGMDSYVKQLLQFAFPFYLWIIIIVIIQVCRRYGKISRLMGSHAVPVLSTLFLLSYTKLVRTIVIVLHKREVTVQCTSKSIVLNLWYEDPNVEYAKGKHAGLFGIALFVSIIFILPYTLFLLFSPLLEKYLSNYRIFRKLWSRFKPIIDAYSGPMKDEYRFWPGLLLVARLPILLSVTLVDSFIRSHFFLLSMLQTVLVIVLSLGHCFSGVYKKRINNIIEVWFLFNLCIMIGLSVAFKNHSESVNKIWYSICLSIFTASFVSIIVYHFYLQLSHMKWYSALLRKATRTIDDQELLLDSMHKTVDEQMKEIIPSSSDVMRDSCESVVDLY